MAWDHREKFQPDKPLDEAEPGEEAVDTRPARRGRGVFTCPGCGVRTYGDMAYCTDCGCKLSHKCSECGAQWRYAYSYSFCPGCGIQLQAREAPETEESGQGDRTVSVEVVGD